MGKAQALAKSLAVGKTRKLVGKARKLVGKAQKHNFLVQAHMQQRCDHSVAASLSVSELFLNI